MNQVVRPSLECGGTEYIAYLHDVASGKKERLTIHLPRSDVASVPNASLGA